MKKYRILAVSAPGGDRGPAVGYRNHIKALSGGNFEIFEIDQRIWDSDELLKSFDVAWAYVRFHHAISEKMQKLGIPVIGGPNIVMERADVGIVDNWEKWYLESQSVSVNVNVAEYYCERVRQFVKNGMKCELLEYCFDTNTRTLLEFPERTNDVLVYIKDRIGDSEASKIAARFCELLGQHGISYEKIVYGCYSREEYIEKCKKSKLTAWFSIEDYCSLAQIESHLAGACVIGTPYNLTIPTVAGCVTIGAQHMGNWVQWEETEKAALSYLQVAEEMLNFVDLSAITTQNCKLRHSYEYYRNNVEKLLSSI